MLQCYTPHKVLNLGAMRLQSSCVIKGLFVMKFDISGYNLRVLNDNIRSPDFTPWKDKSLKIIVITRIPGQ